MNASHFTLCRRHANHLLQEKNVDRQGTRKLGQRRIQRAHLHSDCLSVCQRKEMSTDKKEEGIVSRMQVLKGQNIFTPSRL